jgi:Bifunctional DNA primase/polymerase, N-terminal
MTPLEAAIATGLPCIPCRGDNKAPTIPGPGGHKHATSDPAALHALWRRRPGLLVGVPTGEASGLSVLDIDGPKHPEADVWLAACRAQLPTTRIHRTRSGGFHFVFRHVLGVRNSQGREGRPARGVDTRGEGGYVIWWPAAGYPVVCEASPAPWPQWLLEALFAPAAQSPRPPIHDHRGLLGPAARAGILKPLARAVARAPEGQRHGMLFWAACRVGELIAAGQIDCELGAELLTRAAGIAGLPDIEARRTIADGFARTR